MTVSPGQAQDDDTQPSDPVLEALKRDQAIAEAKQAIVEAEKATSAAKFPSTTGSGVAGSSTFGEGSGYMAQVLAYRSLQEAAAKIADQLGVDESEILLVADADLGRQGQLWEIVILRAENAKSELRKLGERYPTVSGPGQELVGVAMTTAAAILGSASDIASFFRADLEVTAASVQVTPASLLAELASALAKKNWKPVIPSMRLEKTTLLSKIDELLQERRELAEHRSELANSVQQDLFDLGTKRIEKATAENALKAANAKSPPDPTAIEDAERVLRTVKTEIMRLEVTEVAWKRVAAEIDAALAAADTLVEALVEGNPSPVESLAAVDYAKSNEELKILQLEISSQGGEMHATKSAWTNRVTYLGSVAVTYFLIGHDGKPEKSGVIAIPIAHSSSVKKLDDELP